MLMWHLSSCSDVAPYQFVKCLDDMFKKGVKGMFGNRSKLAQIMFSTKYSFFTSHSNASILVQSQCNWNTRTRLPVQIRCIRCVRQGFSGSHPAGPAQPGKPVRRQPRDGIPVGSPAYRDSARWKELQTRRRQLVSIDSVVEWWDKITTNILPLWDPPQPTPKKERCDFHT